MRRCGVAATAAFVELFLTVVAIQRYGFASEKFHCSVRKSHPRNAGGASGGCMVHPLSDRPWKLPPRAILSLRPLASGSGQAPVLRQASSGRFASKNNIINVVEFLERL